MGVVYGLVAAVLWGTADFFARLATERVGTRRTVFYMQLVAWCLVSLLVLPPSHWPSWPDSHALGLASLIGLLNVSGAVMLYRALEIGTVSLVSPVSSTFAAITALLALGAGERPSAAALVGLALTALGVIGVSIPPRQEGAGASRNGIGLAAAAAVCWGIAFFLLRYVVRDLGSYFPVWISRSVSVLVLGSAALAQRQPIARPTGAWRWVVGVAVFDSAAFVAYNAGVATALTSVVSVISALFSAVTVLLAFVVLRERLSAWQWSSVAVIFAGVGLVSGSG